MKTYNCLCGQHLADTDDEKNIKFNNDVYDISRFSEWCSVICPKCLKINAVQGTLDDETWKKLMGLKF
jgi:hypothetical protein